VEARSRHQGKARRRHWVSGEPPPPFISSFSSFASTRLLSSFFPPFLRLRAAVATSNFLQVLRSAVCSISHAGMRPWLWPAQVFAEAPTEDDVAQEAAAAHAPKQSFRQGFERRAALGEYKPPADVRLLKDFARERGTSRNVEGCYLGFVLTQTPPPPHTHTHTTHHRRRHYRYHHQLYHCRHPAPAFLFLCLCHNIDRQNGAFTAPTTPTAIFPDMTQHRFLAGQLRCRSRRCVV
jgi:hypothetical protein